MPSQIISQLLKLNIETMKMGAKKGRRKGSKENSECERNTDEEESKLRMQKALIIF